MLLHKHILSLQTPRLCVLFPMSLSHHFPQSTQAILAAQQTPPRASATNRKHRNKSIIVISSSPDTPRPAQNTCSLVIPDSEEEEDAEFVPLPRPKNSTKENAAQVLEDDGFSRLIGEYKYTSTTDTNKTLPLSDTANIPFPRHQTSTSLRKTSLDGFFQETKPSSKPRKSRVKTTLTTRISVPKKPSPQPTKTISTITQQTSFFTTWAAAQAPTTRSTKGAATKPRKRTTRKSSEVEVVLLS